jgi:hypothetical protein
MIPTIYEGDGKGGLVLHVCMLIIKGGKKTCIILLE